MATNRATALKKLATLAGTWHTTGVMLSGPAAGKQFKGTDRYEWNRSKTFLLHTWRVKMPEGMQAGIELFGFDPIRKEIFAHAYDESGTFTPSSVVFNRGKFIIRGPELYFIGSLSENGQFISGRWLTTQDDQPVMQIELRCYTLNHKV